MSISIWWLIGVLQITVGISIACLFYAYSSKISKNQSLDLKNLLEDTVEDYNALASRIDAKPEVESSDAPSPEEQQVLEKTYERCLALYNNGLETLPDWEPSSFAEGFVPDQLKTAIEIHIAQLLQQESTKESHWEAFASSLAQLIEKETESARYAQGIISTMFEQWVEKKPKLQSIFDTLVTTAQKTELSGQIHEPLNDLYNEFIAILNGLPDLQEASQDALLKMEPAAHSPTNTEADEPTKDLLEDALEDEIEIDVIESDPTSEQATQANSAAEISPETILPLSQYALEDEEDPLEEPASAIPDFDEPEPEPEPEPPPAPTPAAPEPTSTPIVDDGGIDDDMFDDLLSTMDDVIEGTDDSDSTANG